MELYDIVVKLTGNIKPIGSSQEDSKAMSNISEYGKLLEYMIDDLIEISQLKSSKEFSVSAIGDYAYSKLKKIYTMIEENV